MYKTSFCKDGKMDSTYLIGNRIYVKGTYNSFYFEVGDSINIKLGLTEYKTGIIIHINLIGKTGKVQKVGNRHEQENRTGKHHHEYVLLYADRSDVQLLLYTDDE